MSRPHLLSLLAVLALLSIAGQARGDQGPPAGNDTRFVAVSYVETMPSARAAVVAAFNRYREASRTAGASAVELFEQIGRSGHWALIETWPSQAAFDGRDAGAQKQLVQGLEAQRISGYDQRPYKPLAIDDRPAARAASGAVWVISHVDTSPSPQVPELLRRLAATSRREDGSLRFDVTQHTMRANHFTVVEGWASQKALDAHAAAAATRQYRDELQPMTGSPLDERAYVMVP